MKHCSRLVMCVLTLTVTSLTAADGSVKSLESVVNSAGYSMVNPARSDVVPGGFIVANKKHASYNDLPAGVTFPASPGFSASIYSSTSSRSLSLGALISGISKIVSGGASVSHNTSLAVKQIDASGAKIDPSVVIANPTVQAQIKGWLSDTKAGYRVYVVDVALSTTSISITSGSKTEIEAAVGSSLKTCPTDSTTTSTSNTSSGKNDNTDAGTNSTANNTTSTKTTKAASSQNGTSPATPSNAASPSGTLQVCLGANSVLGLSTKTPLVFAASLRAVTLGGDGALSVSPVADISNTKAGEHPEALPKIDWDPKHAHPGSAK